MSNNKQTPARFQSGDWVTVRFGARAVARPTCRARGPLGSNAATSTASVSNTTQMAPTPSKFRSRN